MNNYEKEDQPLILETLGLKEFCDIEFLACQEKHTMVIDKLKNLSKEFPNMLVQDARDMALACAKARKVANTLNQPQAPNRALSNTPMHVPASKSHLHRNPMFRTSFDIKKDDKHAMDLLMEGK